MDRAAPQRWEASRTLSRQVIRADGQATGNPIRHGEGMPGARSGKATMSIRHIFGFGERARLRRENSLLRHDLRVALDGLERQRYAACHDPLTGLPNRRVLCGVRLGAAAIMLDIDWFKWINDRLGHDAGDEVLVVLGSRFARRLGDCWVPARLGGDEFAAIRIGGADEPSLAAEVATVGAALARPMWVGGHRLRVRCSIGLAISRQPVGVSLLLQRADVALATAKQRSSRPLWCAGGEIGSDSAGALPAMRTRDHPHARLGEVSMLVVVTDDAGGAPVRVVARAAVPGGTTAEPVQQAARDNDRKQALPGPMEVALLGQEGKADTCR